MGNLFDKIFNKKAKVQAEQKQQPVAKSQFEPVQRPRYSFVEQYTIIDPKRVMNGGYDLWSWCRSIPVACEDGMKSTGFVNCKQIPTQIVWNFLKTLEKTPSEQIVDPKMRTLTIVNLSSDHRVVILPNFESPKNPYLWPVDDDKDWILYVSPDKNRAIVDAIKIHTR